MTFSEQKKALACAVRAARAAGKLMRQNLNKAKKINSSSAHDIKLDLDVRCQKLIERILHTGFPRISLLGEEGVAGDPKAPQRWVVDPIDGTVNFTYGIPHACVSIALQIQSRGVSYETVVGVVYDPFCDELWTAIRGQPARLNGQSIHVSQRKSLREAIVSIGFAKSKANLDRTLPYFKKLVRRVRKVRMMGAAALAMTYVASGRFDAYIERGIRLWDIAAGGLIVECAGGEFWHEAVPGQHTYRLVASNGHLRKKLQSIR
jgi:myo-inositol-1(or 4)-monophosphatase